jgi:hypothetical protein
VFDSTGRYYKLEVATLSTTDSDGATVQIRYVRRRFIPSYQGATVLAKYSVREGDRLDNIAARYLSDPRQFWLLCDANYVLEPTELTDTIGNVIEITMPQL